MDKLKLNKSMLPHGKSGTVLHKYLLLVAPYIQVTFTAILKKYSILRIVVVLFSGVSVSAGLS